MPTTPPPHPPLPWRRHDSHDQTGVLTDYDTEIRAILKEFGSGDVTVDEGDILEYLQTNTTEIELSESALKLDEPLRGS
ncbi:hypothetical protein ACFPYI_19125 [Halomarina salina]|uniref:Uncharacterized protein n=1 Tax=Halomarina salina TaxID=1872699 RepID=A0ABD5RSE0_9EURY|nr:hypothetical protein [Halomarina salina]